MFGRKVSRSSRVHLIFFAGCLLYEVWLGLLHGVWLHAGGPLRCVALRCVALRALRWSPGVRVHPSVWEQRY